MAKVYLDSGDNFALSSPATVYGSTGTEKVTINAGVTGVVVDANVERIDLAGNSSTYTFQQSGASLKVLSGGVVVATIPLQEDANGTQVVFANGSVEAKVGATTGMTLGGAAVTATAAAVTPTTVDAGTTSGSGTATGGTPAAFTLTADAVTVTEPAQVTAGTNTTANMTFTVKLSAAQTTDTVVNYATSTATGDLATANADYTTTNGSVTIAKGATSATFTVPVIGDGVFDGTVANPTGAESFTVTLSSPTTAFATSTVKGNITDLQANSLPVNTVPATAPQVVLGTNAAVKTISVADANNNTVTVELTASNGLMNLTGTGTVATVTGKATATLTGSVADINTALATLTYASDRTIAGSDTITVKTTDGFGGVDTDVVTVNVVAGNVFTTSTTDNFTGTATDDTFIAVGSGTTVPASTKTLDAGTDKAAAGLGTDTLNLTAALSADVALTNVFTGFEVLNVTHGTNVAGFALDNAKFNSELTKFSFTDGDTVTNTLGFTNIINNTTMTVNSSVTTLTVDAKDATATTLTLALGGDVKVTEFANTGNDVFKTLTIESNGTKANEITGFGTTTYLAADATINLKGAAPLTLTTGNAAATVLAINGADATGALTISAALNTAPTGGTLTLTGGKGADSLTGDADNKSSIVGGDGNDTLVGGTAADTLVGGAGDDSLSGGTGADSLTGGTGKDTYTVNETGDTVVVISGDTGTVAAGTADVVNGLVEGAKIDLSGYYTGVTSSFLANGNLAVATSGASSTLRDIYIDNVKKAIVIEMDATGTTTQEISIGVAATATVANVGGVLTFGAVPMTSYVSGNTIVVEGQSPNNAQTVTADLSTSIPQVYVTTGTATNVNGATTSFANVDLSKLVGATGTVVTGSSVSNTIVGSGLADAITGGAGADTMTGGAGTDTYVIAQAASNSTDGIDRITDFLAGTDVLDLAVAGAGTINTGATTASVSNNATNVASTGVTVATLLANLTTAGAAQQAASAGLWNEAGDTMAVKITGASLAGTDVVYVVQNTTADNAVTADDTIIALIGTSTQAITVATII